MTKVILSHQEEKSYKGKEVFIGIDVHKSFYVATAMCEREIVKTCRMPAGVEQMVNFIKKYFPYAKVKTCYEAGFSGFGLHRGLDSAGIENLVVHAASIEVSAHDRVKTDKRDSKKMASHLESGRLRGIRIPSEEEEFARLLSRTREQLVKSISRIRIQIRMKFHQFGFIDRDERRHRSSKPGGFHPEFLTEPDVKLSLHPALPFRPQVSESACQ